MRKRRGIIKRIGRRDFCRCRLASIVRLILKNVFDLQSLSQNSSLEYHAALGPVRRLFCPVFTF